MKMIIKKCNAQSNGFSRSLLLSALFAIGTGMSPAIAEEAKPSQLATMLKQGGYVIYTRHTSTERDYADQVTADVNNCATQRTLSENGWDEATLIGASFDILNIPVGAIYSSEYCRAWKTARIAFGMPVKLSALNFEKAEEYTLQQTEVMKNNVQPLISQVPASGTNTVIVGHDDPFEAATGIYPEPQGVTYVLRPKQNGEFEIMGSITPKQWPEVLASQ